MNAVSLVFYNTTAQQLELTKDAIASVLAQDCGPIHLWVIDNGSTYETFDWLRSLKVPEGSNIELGRFPTNQSPVRIANLMMKKFYEQGYGGMFGIPNDVVLPVNCFSEMLRFPRGIVTASMTNGPINPKASRALAVSTNTPTAISLIRKWAYDALMAKDGYF